MVARSAHDDGDVELVAEEDLVRARFYRLLARLLAGPPSRETLDAIAGIGGDETALGRELAALSRVAARMQPKAVEHEFHDLFIGLGRGELLPYASYYLTGFLHEKPLARLRGDMGRLGIERDPAVSEPEDHVAALMEMMAGLIMGEFDEPSPIDVQRQFFHDHIASWVPHFFRDLEQAGSSVFYGPVGGVGRVFMEIEDAAFAMD